MICKTETYYQNICDADGQVIKRELLTRLPPYDNGLRLGEFFETITPADSLEITIRQLELGSKVYSNTRVVCSVNVDNYVWLDDALKVRLVNACKQYSHPIILEFTELRPMPPADEINSVFLELKRNGVQLALDDFGTGLNGMSVFADYDFDIVKLDRKLTLGIKDRPQKLKVLSHVLELLNVLGKGHVVEGVEEQEQLKALIAVGFSVFQGFVFHHPAPVKEII